MEINDLFSQPINDLPVSADFKKMATSLNFQTLHDILEVEAADLLKMPGMSYHMLQEFIQFLEENGQAHLLED